MRDVLRSRADTLTLLAIQDSIPTYRSEIKCWLLFLQASGRTMREVLNPDVSIVIQYITIFTNVKTAEKYVQALRWLHDRFQCDIVWDTRALRAHLRGVGNLSKNLGVFRKKAELSMKQMMDIVVMAERWGEIEFATICSSAAEFLFRVPSECLKLCYDSLDTHSKIEFKFDPTGASVVGVKISLKKAQKLSAGMDIVSSVPMFWSFLSTVSAPLVLYPPAL